MDIAERLDCTVQVTTFEGEPWVSVECQEIDLNMV